MTKIPWTNETWNWLSGCTKVSPGCQNCYAEKMSFRLAMMGQEPYARIVLGNGRWTEKTYFNKKAISKPLKWEKPRMIFVNSMSDTFHETNPFVWMDRAIDVMQITPQHTYQILTKRPEIMLKYFTEWRPEHFIGEDLYILPNLWLGVTAENQEQADKRIPILLQIPAAKRFVSIEPQLGPVDLCNFQVSNEEFMDALKGKINIACQHIAVKPADCNKLDWVICGAESGPGRRPFFEDWARRLRDQCKTANMPFFYKQRYIGNKKYSMPELDGVVWNQIPER
jgi:protein gp37